MFNRKPQNIIIIFIVIFSLIKINANTILEIDSNFDKITVNNSNFNSLLETALNNDFKAVVNTNFNSLLKTALNSDFKAVDTTITSGLSNKKLNPSTFINSHNKTQAVYCGAEEYDNSINYSKDDTVFFNCIIWNRGPGKASSGIDPGIDNTWIFIDNCYDSLSGCTEPKPVCGIEPYNKYLLYHIDGTRVYYDCKIWYSAGYMDQTVETPIVPGTTSSWQYESDCNESTECTEPDYGYCGAQMYNEYNIYSIYDTLVYYNNKLYQNSSYIGAGQLPGTDAKWVYQGECIDPTATGRTLSNDDEALKANILLYYNNYKLYYDFTKLNGTSKIICYDTKGSLIFSKEVSNSKNEIIFPTLQQGLYIIRVINDSKMTFKRIIVL
ncbi:T9SS type A sorting domain-containing protein [Lutibacter flavus]|uniref:Por secretion system C-terminal sorting domain-containing protein n=1 Tax=Lutibacter flavus TaxID=691689 RepID=A0A238VGP1_9FLAO|nr:T9SS type A sorting domain-containing protein [Lutibacter flavus]SNR33416.1 Por secretion system C-terminal sorting domain-containing protein [Lutibacter flavus]